MGIGMPPMGTTSMSTEAHPPLPRLTRQRQLILDRLAEADEFLSAQQVYGLLRADGESIGLATVYRGVAVACGRRPGRQHPQFRGRNYLSPLFTGPPSPPDLPALRTRGRGGRGAS